MQPRCTACRSVLGSLVKRHTTDQCPLRASLYCGLCASYGHSPAGCPDTVTRGYREPQYVEQLLPASLLESYNIRTQTPLENAPANLTPEEPMVWEVHDSEESLRATLTNLGVKPMICQEKGKKEQRELKENKKRLQAIADQRRIKILWIGGQPPAAPAAAGGKKVAK